MSHSSADSGLTNRGNPPGADPFPPDLEKLRGLSLIVGVVCLGLCFIAWMFPSQREHFFRSWLFAYMFWLSITLGSLTLVMITHMTGGGWGVVMRRFGETAAQNLPLMLLFFLPLTLSYWYLFPWGHLEKYQADPERYKDIIEVIQHRQPWFTGWMFTIRHFVYYAIWGFFAVVVIGGSRQLDKADNPRLRRRIRMFCAAGVLLYFVTITSYGMDFVMSRETHWYSSILGFIIAVGQGAAGMAFMSLNVCYFSERKPIKDVLQPQHLNDFGNMLLTLTILWAYTSFAQLLVIWNGNITEDVGYYVRRGLGFEPNPWRWVALFLIVGNFFLPFFLLLMKQLKRKAPTLAAVAALMLVMRIVENLWLTAPSGPNRLTQTNLDGVYWTDIVAWLGMGGIWMFSYLLMLSGKPLLPQNASDQPEILTNGIHGAQPHAG
jgi:hypothetical protein